jgi:ribonuclease E
MSRQRLRPSLGESSQEACPRCDGHGRIRSVESLALSILRLVDEESMKDYTGQVIVQAPTTVANFLLNEKRKGVAEIEARHAVPIVILSNEYMERPKFEIHRVRKSDVSEEPSYERVSEPEAELVASDRSKALASPAVAAVSGIMPGRPIPVREEAEAVTAVPVQAKARQGFFGMLFAKLFAGAEQEHPAGHGAAAAKPQAKPQAKAEAAKPARPAERRAGTERPDRGGDRPQQRRDQDGDARSSRGGRRGGKKRPQRSAEDTGRPEGQKKAKRKPRKKASRKKTGEQRAEGQPPAQAGSGEGQAEQAGSQPGSQPGSAHPEERKSQGSGEQSQESGTRRGRRRRSPYQTSGNKPREEVAGGDGKRQPESGNSEGAAETRPALPPADPSRSAGSLVEVKEEGKGIYTLKPKEGDSSATGDKPAAESSKPPVAESADRA